MLKPSFQRWAISISCLSLLIGTLRSNLRRRTRRWLLWRSSFWTSKLWTPIAASKRRSWWRRSLEHQIIKSMMWQLFSGLLRSQHPQLLLQCLCGHCQWTQTSPGRRRNVDSKNILKTPSRQLRVPLIFIGSQATAYCTSSSCHWVLFQEVPWRTSWRASRCLSPWLQWGEMYQCSKPSSQEVSPSST